MNVQSRCVKYHRGYSIETEYIFQNISLELSSLFIKSFQDWIVVVTL